MDEAQYEQAERNARSEIDSGIALAGKYKKQEPKGFCYNCEALLDVNLLFCNTECREDFDYILSVKKKQGLS